MEDLELVAEGVLAAGCEVMAERAGPPVGYVIDGMVGIVSRRARVSVLDAHAALERASARCRAQTGAKAFVEEQWPGM